MSVFAVVFVSVLIVDHLLKAQLIYQLRTALAQAKDGNYLPLSEFIEAYSLARQHKWWFANPFKPDIRESFQSWVLIGDVHDHLPHINNDFHQLRLLYCDEVLLHYFELLSIDIKV